jgi:transcriptional regulator with XRE-family HTH domain
MGSGNLIGRRLRRARETTEYSQKKLGIAAGFDRFSASPRINHYETGRHYPNFPVMKRLAKLLKLPTAYFYAEEDDLAELIVLYSRLSERRKKELLKNLRLSKPIRRQ